MALSNSPAAIRQRRYRENHAVVPRNDSVSHADGWGNVISGMGDKAYDRKMSTYFNPEMKLPEMLLVNLLTYSGLFRKTIMLPIYDALRKWPTIEGDTDNLFANETKRLGIKQQLTRGWWNSRTFGGALVVLHINDGRKLDQPLDENNIRDIEAIRVYSRWRTARLTYYMDPADPRYAETETFTVSPQTQFSTSFVVHESRCLMFDGVDVPPIIRAQNQWWGDSVGQQIYQTLSFLGEAISHCAHLIGEYSLLVTKIKGLSAKLAGGQEGEVVKRMQMVNLTRSLMGSYLLDADGEDAQRLSVTAAGLSDLLQVLMMRYSADTNIPCRKLFGSRFSGSGLQSDDDEETQDYYDYVSAVRYDEFEAQIERLARLLMLQKQGPWAGKESAGWKMVWAPLAEEPMEKQIANKKTQADIDRSYWDMGVLGDNEIRDSRFGGDTYSHDTRISKKAPHKAGLENEQQGQRGDSSDGVDVSHSGLTDMRTLRLPEEYDGFVNVSHNSLTDLGGSPRKCGAFSCNGNPITSLVGGPEITADYHCPGCKELTTLSGGPKECTHFHCHDTAITNFVGGPQKVTGDYVANSCRVNSMEGLPEEIPNGDLLLQNNQLTTLDFLPKRVGRNLDLSGNPITFDEADVRARCVVGGTITL